MVLRETSSRRRSSRPKTDVTNPARRGRLRPLASRHLGCHEPVVEVDGNTKTRLCICACRSAILSSGDQITAAALPSSSVASEPSLQATKINSPAEQSATRNSSNIEHYRAGLSVLVSGALHVYGLRPHRRFPHLVVVTAHVPNDAEEFRSSAASLVGGLKDRGRKCKDVADLSVCVCKCE